MNIEVTSASKKEQKISRVAAAIYVITQDDIRRAGATSIPDLLRMVPGVDVAQSTGNSWAVSTRGFNQIWADKILVLIDGRSVYNPALSGTLWDTQDVPLPDIERIEVIRGPGATVWGANAVNGVINIITKNSRDTAGGLIEVAAGSQLTQQSLAQYGGAIGSLGNYRIFGDSTMERPNSGDVLGNSAADPGRIHHFGLRSDWKLSNRDTLLVEADLASSNDTHTYDSFYSYKPPYMGIFPDSSTSHTASVLGKWTRTLSPTSDVAFQAYFDHIDYSMYGLHQTVTTGDFDFQYHFAAGNRNDIVWGLDARVQPDTINGGYAASFVHPSHTNWLVGAFLQDEIQLTDSFWLTIGTKVEHNDYTGTSLQPSIRALWAPNKRHSVWAAISRALREPSREDEDVSVNAYAIPLQNGLTGIVVQSGNPAIQAEQLTAYESGYRFEPSKRLSLDISTFFNQYSKLLTSEPAGQPFLAFDPSPVHVTIPQIFTNGTMGYSYGAEISGGINVSRHFKLSPGYSLLHTVLTPDATATGDPYIVQGDAPRHQLQLRTSVTLRPNVSVDTAVYYVSSLVHALVPAYVRVDTRLGWRVSDNFELGLVGQNLADHHYEFGLLSSSLSVPTYMGRSAYLRGAWHF